MKSIKTNLLSNTQNTVSSFYDVHDDQYFLAFPRGHYQALPVVYKYAPAEHKSLLSNEWYNKSTLAQNVNKNSGRSKQTVTNLGK